jgi:hypothetical protein
MIDVWLRVGGRRSRQQEQCDNAKTVHVQPVRAFHAFSPHRDRTDPSRKLSAVIVEKNASSTEYTRKPRIRKP